MTSKKATGTLTVGNIIKVASVRFRDREALYCPLTERRFTYGELNRRTNSLANGLLGLGAGSGAGGRPGGGTPASRQPHRISTWGSHRVVPQRRKWSGTGLYPGRAACGNVTR